MKSEIQEQLSRLAAFAPTTLPVISVYLDTRANERGRDQFAPWVRKELVSRAQTFDPKSRERQSFETDRERIESWLAGSLDPASNGVAIFACAQADNFWEAIQLSAPIQQNELHVQLQPHVYPLARILDQYPRYAAVIADTNSARIVVFGLNRVEAAAEVQGVKTNRTMVGGWSQARFQRHVDEFHKKHAKEVVETLERVLREENLEHFVLAGDQEVVIPLLKAEIPRHLTEMMVDVLRLDAGEPDHVLLAETMEALKSHDTKSDADKVQYLIDEYRSGGLAVAGVVDTLTALEQGQVDELIVAAAPSAIEASDEALAMLPQQTIDSETDKHALIADLLITMAKQTSAKLTFVEDSGLLASLGGCGAILRYKTGEPMPKKGNYNHDYYRVRGKEPGNTPRESQEESTAKSSSQGSGAPRKARAQKPEQKKRARPQPSEQRRG